MISESLIIRPIVTEKTTELTKQNKYVFLVDGKATRLMIKKAVEEAFPVKVKDVNIGKIYGKRKRVRYAFKKREPRKKAIVTLYPGYKIDIIQNV
jgi:large subunit ribosomal protein L23